MASEIDRADLIVTLKSQEKRQPGNIREAEARGTPRYVLKSNTTTQMENFLRSLFPSEEMVSADEDAGFQEARAAVEAVREHGRAVELLPRTPGCEGSSTYWPSKAGLYREHRQGPQQTGDRVSGPELCPD